LNSPKTPNQIAAPDPARGRSTYYAKLTERAGQVSLAFGERELCRMESLRANEVFVVGCTDQCEGWLEFQWPDPLMGWESLQIDFDGFCSRRMGGLRSGRGLCDLKLSRGCVRLWFTDELAGKLGLPRALEIGFTLSDEKFAQIERGVDCIGWPAPPLPTDAEQAAAPDPAGT
jgi:hypothetical protein